MYDSEDKQRTLSTVTLMKNTVQNTDNVDSGTITPIAR